jgi:hypothetical protein
MKRIEPCPFCDDHKDWPNGLKKAMNAMARHLEKVHPDVPEKRKREAVKYMRFLPWPPREGQPDPLSS